MNNRNTLSTIILTLCCIRVLSFFISFIGVKLLGNGLVDDFLNALYHINTAIHITVMLFIAYALNLIKEDLWRSVAFILLALMSAVFMTLALTKSLNSQTFKITGMVNMAIILFFVFQSFFIRSSYFKSAFRIYSVVVLLMVAFNSVIPLIVYRMALPISFYRYTSLLSIFPAAVECYIVYLFQQYFNANPVYQNNDFISDL